MFILREIHLVLKGKKANLEMEPFRLESSGLWETHYILRTARILSALKRLEAMKRIG